MLHANNVPMKTVLEPCQQHQRNVCLEALNQEMTRCMRCVLQGNNEAVDNRLCIHLDITSCVRVLCKHWQKHMRREKGAHSRIICRSVIRMCYFGMSKA